MSSRYIHLDRIPQSPCLVVPGRLDRSSLVGLEKKFESKDIIYLIEEESVLSSEIQTHLEGTDHKGVSFSLQDEASSLGKELKRQIGPNGVFIYLPGEVSKSADLVCEIPASVLEKLMALGIPVLPVVIHSLSTISLSIQGERRKEDFILCFGELVEPSEASVSSYLQRLYEAEEAAFSRRSFLNGSLAEALLEGMKKHRGGMIYDGASDESLPYDQVLGIAIAFAKELKKITMKQRVGIILPPGKGGLIANLAVLFAGKVPVNLNFTASEKAVRSAIKQADIDRFITADPFVRKVPAFPWPPNRDLIYIERLLPQMKKKILKWVFLSKILPTKTLSKLLKLGERKGEEEAVLLFTSGSSGDPKGVALSHRNILANICQFGSRLALDPGAKILGSLPLFHSFGCTVTLWYPIIEGLSLVTYPSPLETKRIAELIEEQKVNLLLSTPTFLRGYLSRVKVNQFASLRYVVTGAEKLPQSLAQSFKKKFGFFPLEGYGLTETSPATHVNLVNKEQGDAGNSQGQTEQPLPVIPSFRLGTVGLLLPGMAIRVTDPITEKPVGLDQGGIIHLKGANVFQGYLGKEELNKTILNKDGWFKTGDIGRVDHDGFLTIEGRISRFSKIGGEMIPHEVVEESINTALGLEDASERKIAVVGIPDEKKGEALMVLSTLAGSQDLSLDQQAIELRYKLLDAGLPSLWCPKIIKPVEAIPVLASGKLDIKACEILSLEEDDAMGDS